MSVQRNYKEALAKMFYSHDARNPPDHRRQGQFKAGWEDAALRKRIYTKNTLEHLTWRNLGYRFGKLLGPRSVDEINEVYAYLSDQYTVEKKLDKQPYEPTKPYSVEEYKTALLTVADKLSGIHYQMLQAQYEAPKHTITAVELAQALGYKNYSSANLHYGRLARLLGETLGCKTPPLDKDNPVWWPILSAGISGTSQHGFKWVMHLQLVQALEAINWIKIPTHIFPEEITESEAKTLYEGSVRQVTVNTYERNPEARRKCIAYYGSRCYVCCFDFEKEYGEVGRGLIHVHHERPLASIGEEYEVDPIKDLKPVCPNCHTIIHRRVPSYSIAEVKEMLRKNENSTIHT